MKNSIRLASAIMLCATAFSACAIKTNPPKTEVTTETSAQSENTHYIETPITDFEYEISKDGKHVYINRYIGNDETVVIPSVIDGRAVKSLKGTWIGGGITNGVFENSTTKAVYVPNSVTTIGVNAFKDCKELTSVTISDKCERILDSAFENCVKLSCIDLSQTEIISIGTSAFEGCTELSEIQLPKSLSTIKKKAFYDCFKLLELHLPKEIVTIEGEAFYNCLSLKLITVPAKLDLCAFDSVRFYNVPSLKKIVFEEGRDVIDGYAFFDITSYVEITIPKSVKEFSSLPFFAHGPIKYVFEGDCPIITEDVDFLGEPTIYYYSNTSGWNNCVWLKKYTLLPLE